MFIVQRMDLNSRYPALSDLRDRAQQRIPKFVWEYLDSGTGDERTRRRNRTALDRVGLMPSILHGEFEANLSTTLMGQQRALPFGIAPVGMSGLMWPDAENHLAQGAARLGIPYTLSTVAAASPEDVAPVLGRMPGSRCIRRVTKASARICLTAPALPGSRRWC